MADGTLLLVGLGNPGPKYEKNRHNIGFLALDRIHARHGFPPWRRRFQGDASEGSLAGRRVLLLKPLTYMNESGRAVAEAARFFKIPPADVAVLHDELDLAPAKVRVKTGGGNAGHNGLRSIAGQFDNEVKRIRLGIGHPGDKALVHGFVLNDFAKSEMPWVEALCDILADNIELIARGDDATFQNRVHLAMEAAGFAEPKRPGRAAAD